MVKRTKTRRGRKTKRGGEPYSSASSYGNYVNGSGNDQYDRVFSQNSSINTHTGNAIIGVQGQVAGKRRRKGSKKIGGTLGMMLSQAIAPLSIFAMQQTYRNNKGNDYTRKQKYSPKRY